MFEIIETYQQEQEKLAKPESSPFCLATAVSDSDTGLSVVFDGETEPSTKNFPKNKNAEFAPNDRVLMVKVNGTYIALAPLLASEPITPLPPGYARHKYIRSSGVQLIDTLVVPDSSFVIELTAAFSTTQGSQFFGAYSADNVPYVEIGAMSGAWLAAFGQNYQLGGSADTLQHTFTIRHANGTTELLIDGNLFYQNSDSISGVVDTFKLFGRGDISAAMTLYRCKMTKDGQRVRNFIPCSNGSSEVGLYDTVSGTFFRNSGTGTFDFG